MREVDPPNNTLTTELIRHFPGWFTAIFALIYISGYLIDFFYYGYLGITDTGSEPLKLHYVEIGLVFMLGYMIVVGVLFFAVFGAGQVYHSLWADDDRPWSNVLTSIMIISFFLSLYVAAIFTPPHYFQNHWKHFTTVLELIGFVTAGSLLVLLIEVAHLSIAKLNESSKHSREKKDLRHQKLHRTVELIRSLIIAGIIIAIGVFDFFIFRELFDDLSEMFLRAGWVYFAFAMIFSLMLFRVIKRLSVIEVGFGYCGIVFLGSTVMVMIYFLSLVTYAYAIFPYIASVKGGADYTAAPRAKVQLRLQARGVDPNPFPGDYIVLYTTSTTIYLADLKGPSNPCQWRARTELPKIIGVMRREVDAIEVSAAPRGTLHPNCNVQTKEEAPHPPK